MDTFIFAYILPFIMICIFFGLLYNLIVKIRRMFFLSKNEDEIEPPKIKPRFDEAEEKFMEKYLKIVTETFELYFNEYPTINDNIKSIPLNDKNIKLETHGYWDGERGYIYHEVPDKSVRNHGVVAVYFYFSAVGDYEEHAQLIYRLRDSIIKSIKKRIPQNADCNIRILQIKNSPCLRVKFLWPARCKDEEDFSYQKDDIDFKLLELKDMHKRRKGMRLKVPPDVLAKRMLNWNIKSYRALGYDEPHLSVRETYHIFIDVSSWDNTVYIAKILENNELLQKSKRKREPRKINVDLAQKFIAGHIEIKF